MRVAINQPETLFFPKTLEAEAEAESRKQKQNKIRAHRLRLLEEAVIDLIHGGEIGHIGQIHIDLDAVLQRAAGFFEDCGKVFETLGLFVVVPVRVESVSVTAYIRYI